MTILLHFPLASSTSATSLSAAGESHRECELSYDYVNPQNLLLKRRFALAGVPCNHGPGHKTSDRVREFRTFISTTPQINNNNSAHNLSVRECQYYELAKAPWIYRGCARGRARSWSGGMLAAQGLYSTRTTY